MLLLHFLDCRKGICVDICALEKVTIVLHDFWCDKYFPVYKYHGYIYFISETSIYVLVFPKHFCGGLSKIYFEKTFEMTARVGTVLNLAQDVQ